MECISLKERFGHKYKVEYEESYYAEYGPNARVEDLWLMIIPCRNGHICPWGGQKLAACTNRAGPIARRLKGLPYTTVTQDGDDGANVVFPVEKFDEVAAIVKPRTRKRLSSEAKRRLIEAGASYRFSRGADGLGAARESKDRRELADRPHGSQKTPPSRLSSSTPASAEVDGSR